jgi:hypothetical protein
MHRRNSGSEFYRSSRAQASKCKAAASNAARIHEFGFWILEQLLDDCFRVISIGDLSIDHVVICIVSSEHAAITKVGRIFFRRAVTFARLSMNKIGPVSEYG